jgi:hypothetical protein
MCCHEPDSVLNFRYRYCCASWANAMSLRKRLQAISDARLFLEDIPAAPAAILIRGNAYTDPNTRKMGVRCDFELSSGSRMKQFEMPIQNFIWGGACRVRNSSPILIRCRCSRSRHRVPLTITPFRIFSTCLTRSRPRPLSCHPEKPSSSCPAGYYKRPCRPCKIPQLSQTISSVCKASKPRLASTSRWMVRCSPPVSS